MLTYADPSACPACRARLSSARVCPRCGFDLDSEQAHEVWRLFTQVDRVLATVTPVVSEPIAPPVATEHLGSGTIPPAAPAAAAPERRRVSWSAGSVLLTLGALFLLVAGAIFLTVAWGSMGLVGRTVIMLVITAAFGLGALWSSGRGLRASSESLWAIFLGLLSLDWFYAWSEDLLGLGALDFVWTALVWSVAMVGFGVTASLADGRHLVVPQLLSGISGLVATVAIVGRLGDVWPYFWAVSPALAFLVVGTAVMRRRGRRGGTVCWAIIAALVGVTWVLAAFVRVSSQGVSLAVADVVPLVIVSFVAAAAGTVVPRIREAASFFIVIAAAWLISLVVYATWHGHGGPAAAGLVGLSGFVVVGAVVPGTDAAVLRGVRRAMATCAGTLLVLSTGVILGGPWWIAGLGFAAAAVLAGSVVRWQEVPTSWRNQALPAAAVLAALAVAVATTAADHEFGVEAWAIPVIVAVAALAIVLNRLRSHDAWRLAPLLLAGVAPALLGDVAWVWFATAASLAVCAVLPMRAANVLGEQVAALAAAMSVVTAGAGAWFYLDQYTNLADARIGCVLAAISAVAVVCAMALDEWPGRRIGVECGLGVVAVIGLTLASRPAPGFDTADEAVAAFAFSVVGLGLVVVGLLDDERRWFRWAGSAALGIAWVLRLSASGVDVVEAYTAPFAIVALAVGWWAMRSDPDLRTWIALGPGVALALTPSLPLILEDPGSLRAAILGAVALVMLAGGILLRWQAPLVGAAVALAVVAVAELLPLVAGMERWITIAVVGSALMAVGLTWDKRVAEGRAVLMRLARLR